MYPIWTLGLYVRSIVLNSLSRGLNLRRLILVLAFSTTLITFLNSYYSSYQVQKQQLIDKTLNNHKAYAFAVGNKLGAGVSF